MILAFELGLKITTAEKYNRVDFERLIDFFSKQA